MTKLSLIVDIDDVIYPFATAAHRASIAHGLCPEGSPEPDSWTPFEVYGCEPDYWWEALHRATYDGTLYSHPPIPGAIQALWRLEAAGHFIHLVTARATHPSIEPEVAELIQAATRRWVAEHWVPFDTLTFSHDKTVVPGDYGVDDNTGNYDALEAAGVVVWLIDRPWNQDPDGKTRRRVNDLGAFADLILTKEAIPA